MKEVIRYKRSVNTSRSGEPVRQKKQLSSDSPEDRHKTKGDQSGSEEEDTRNTDRTMKIKDTSSSPQANVIRILGEDDQVVRNQEEKPNSNNARKWKENTPVEILQTTNKALGKLNILRKLCGTSWGSRPQTLKSTFCTVIRPVLEYATPIWTPASISVKRKLDSVQHRAAKIIIGAVSSTNNEKAEQECGLPPLESRRKLATIKFTNKYAHMEPSFQKTHQRILVSNWNCCSHVPKKDPVTLRQKGLETIAILFKITLQSPTLMVPQTDPLSNGGAGIILLLPDAAQQKKILYPAMDTPHMSTLRGNECADSLAKEARDIEHKCTTITLDDANAVAKHRIMNHTFKNP
ncbi:uncharacterized protein TNCV_255661 [Trichonephila clavipes]|nr:uncharacterized protein TNCV_255661 [Trichonephila clavipes]